MNLNAANTPAIKKENGDRVSIDPGPGFCRTIGIVGGLGPHAHLEFERLLLRHASLHLGRSLCDQDYPEWILSSIPATPDRTEALRNEGPSPVPWIERSLRQLEGTSESRGADFAVIVCITAHAFLRQLEQTTRIPILNIVNETLTKIARMEGIKTVGLLATTGTLQAKVFEREGRQSGSRLSLISLFDAPEGASLQEELVMDAIYGVPDQQGRRMGGIKSGAAEKVAGDSQSAILLRSAAQRLADQGADIILTACTEVALALGRDSVEGIPLLDPVDVAAEAAIEIAAGRRPLPEQ